MPLVGFAQSDQFAEHIHVRQAGIAIGGLEVVGRLGGQGHGLKVAKPEVSARRSACTRFYPFITRLFPNFGRTLAP